MFSGILDSYIDVSLDLCKAGASGPTNSGLAEKYDFSLMTFNI